MGVSMNDMCTGVECNVHWQFGERRLEVRTYIENLVDYNINVSGMWTEYLKCDNHPLISFLTVLNSFRRRNL